MHIFLWKLCSKFYKIILTRTMFSITILRRSSSRKKIVVLFVVLIVMCLTAFRFWPKSYDQVALIRFYNRMGKLGVNYASLDAWLSLETIETGQFVRAAFDFPAEWKLSKINHHAATNGRTADPAKQMNLVVVSCGNRLDEAKTMIKSALLLSQDSKSNSNLILNVIAFGDYDTMPEFAKELLLLKWKAQQHLGVDFSFELHSTWFPPQKSGTWRKMWRPCATQRLFLSTLLPEYDSIIYVDTDVIFLSNVTAFWNYFDKMDSSQFATMVANDEVPGNGWYNLHSKIPYFGQRGLNAGIMHMNLTRMRNFDFEKKCLDIYTKYEEQIFLADQDILNILFSLHPELVLELPCDVNFRSSHCSCEHDGYKGDLCKCSAAQTSGVSIVHGNQLAFRYSDRNCPFMRNMFSAFKEYNFVEKSLSDFVEGLKSDFTNSLAKKDEENPPCFDLNVDQLYGKLQVYVEGLVAATGARDEDLFANDK